MAVSRIVAAYHGGALSPRRVDSGKSGSFSERYVAQVVGLAIDLYIDVSDIHM